MALLRGVNVGGNKKVPMGELKALLEKLGHRDVATLLNSGNAVFTSKSGDSKATGKALEVALAKKFGFEVPVVARTRDELQAAIKANPLPVPVASASAFLVFFLSAPPDAARLGSVLPKAFAPDEFKVVGTHLYARFPNGIRDSKLAVALGNPKLGVVSTGRNWNTVLKLLDLADRSSDD